MLRQAIYDTEGFNFEPDFRKEWEESLPDSDEFYVARNKMPSLVSITRGGDSSSGDNSTQSLPICTLVTDMTLPLMKLMFHHFKTMMTAVMNIRTMIPLTKGLPSLSTMIYKNNATTTWFTGNSTPSEIFKFQRVRMT
jgi:hypothetical protein